MGAWPFEFGAEVAEILAAIPAGRVMTVTAVAEGLGDPVARGAVENFLRHGPPDLPRGRVVDDAGRPLRPGPTAQRPAEEGAIQVNQADTIPWRMSPPRLPLQRLQAEQEAMARRALLQDDFDETGGIAGADVAYREDLARGAVVVLDSSGTPTARSTAEVPTSFPYIPTYLAYREFPAVAAALEPVRPSLGLLMVEGHGALHPRRAGLATFVGVTLDLPTLGVAKGSLGFPPVEGLAPGETKPIQFRAGVLGHAVGVAHRRRPIYVSPGHRISAETAVRIAAAQCKGHMPEPLRLADALAREKERGKEV